MRLQLFDILLTDINNNNNNYKVYNFAKYLNYLFNYII